MKWPAQPLHVGDVVEIKILSNDGVSDRPRSKSPATLLTTSSPMQNSQRKYSIRFKRFICRHRRT